MKSYWLILYRHKEEKKVTIINDHINANLCQFTQYRISPIFPISENYELPSFEKNIYILFFFVKNPFTTLIEILRLYSKTDIEKHLWISHGLAAIVYISESEKERNEITNLFLGLEEDNNSFLQQNIIAIQEWIINNTKLESSNILLEPEKPNANISIENYSNLPTDLQNDILEFTNCIESLIQLSMMYTPNFTNGYRSLIEKMNEIIEELDNLFNSNFEKLDSSSDMGDNNLYERNERLLKINGLTEEIVQINSTLSYVISQGYAGVIPIEENPSLIRSYSLLGVGTAHKGINTFYKFIKKNFSIYPIAKVIQSESPEDPSPYETLESIPLHNINGSVPEDYIQEWQKNENWNLDCYFNNKKNETNADIEQSEKYELMDLMVYFSGRQGFSESLYSISIAIQSLYLGITNRWNIYTITHEIMHSHVKYIYSVLQDRLDKNFKRDFSSFIIDDPSESCLYSPRLLDGISHIILHFSRLYYKCMMTDEVIDVDDLSDKAKIRFPPDKKLYTIKKINQSTEDIVNEIMTHTLDFLYFYQGNVSLYLSQIWLSWAALPTTPANLVQYIIRSVCTIATIEDESLDIESRLENSREKNIDILEKLCKYDDSINNVIYSKAIETIKSENHNIHPNLDVLLKSCLYLADATKKFFYIDALQIKLLYDNTQKIDYSEVDVDDNMDYDYALTRGKFEGESIMNPVKFLLSEINTGINNGGNYDFEKDRYDTLWLYFVLSSLKDEEEL